MSRLSILPYCDAFRCRAKIAAGGGTSLITVGMSAAVSASRSRVWAALADPAQVARWRPGVVALREGGGAYPRVGQPVAWRCRVRELPIVLHETPTDVVPGERLHARLRLGLFHYEAHFTLAALAGETTRARVGLQIQVPNELPLVGGTLDRFDVRRLATELAATDLMALRDWCEAHRPGERRPAPPSPLPEALVSAAY
jgi:uncharacterized protein YndB with AHSA1/START domain